jgi:hypothetical protein
VDGVMVGASSLWPNSGCFYELCRPFTAKANHYVYWHLGDFELGFLLMAILSPRNVIEPLLSHIANFMSHLGPVYIRSQDQG